MRYSIEPRTRKYTKGHGLYLLEMFLTNIYKKLLDTG